MMCAFKLSIQSTNPECIIFNYVRHFIYLLPILISCTIIENEEEQKKKKKKTQY